jgi:hypothetical protein
MTVPVSNTFSLHREEVHRESSTETPDCFTETLKDSEIQTDNDLKQTDCDVSAKLAMPLDAYIRVAFNVASEQYELHSYDEGWQSPMFGFARLAKAHQELRELDSSEALGTVQALLADDGEVLDEEDEIDFMTCWDAIRRPLGDFIEIANVEAVKNPFVPLKRRGLLYRRFLSIARALQVTMEPHPIMLPCHKLADLLHCTPKTISNLRKFAINDGYLEIVEVHDRNAHRATRFYFNTGEQDR